MQNSVVLIQQNISQHVLLVARTLCDGDQRHGVAIYG